MRALSQTFQDATAYALGAHAEQVRKGTTVPYVSHLLAVASMVPAIGVAASCFKVMDATLYVDKPDMRALGIQPVKLVEPPRWWRGVPEDGKSVKEATIKANMSRMGLSAARVAPIGTPHTVSSAREPKLACTNAPTVYVSGP